MVDSTNPTNPNSGPEPAAQAPSAEASKIEELEAALKAAREEAKEKENKYLYLYAEFENFKKRAIKERSDLVKFGWEPVARDLLQVADNLELALAHAPANIDKNFLQGVQMVMNQFRSSLEKQGVQQVPAVDKPFDPNFHEAVGQEQSQQPAGTVIKEAQRGYLLHGRLLRPARVIVSAGA